MKKNPFFDFLKKWSMKTRLPLLLLAVYLPGYLLTTVLVTYRFGFLGHVALLAIEVWEINALYKREEIPYKGLAGLIILHAHLCWICHIVNVVRMKINPDTAVTMTDDKLLQLRVVYVIAFFVYIVVKQALQTDRNR